MSADYFAPPVRPEPAPLENPVFRGVVTLPAGTPAAPGALFDDVGNTGLTAAPGSLAAVAGGVEAARFGGPGQMSTLGAGQTGAFHPGVMVAETSHAVSRHTQLYLGSGWVWGQDGSQDGKRTLYLWWRDLQPDGSAGPSRGHVLWWGSDATLHIGAQPGGESLRVPRVAWGVNGLQIAGAPTGQSPTLSVTGADANVHLRLAAKGDGTVVIANLPTSPAGLPPGGLWNDGGTLKVA